MLVSIPPKYAVSQVIGFIKGKSAVHIVRAYGESKRNFVDQSFSGRAFRPVGPDETVIREPSRTNNQETENNPQEQRNLC
jgi:putative transposase